MDGIPALLLTRFLSHLKQSMVPESSHAEYLQWLRYYLHFCRNFPVPDSKSERVRLFCEKLGQKQKTVKQLGHSSLKTTMIYTHCVPVRTVKEPRSPLDF